MKRITRLLIASAIAATVLLVGTHPVAAEAPPGWNGDIKTHEGAAEPSPVTRDEPKVCTFHLHGFNFDPSQEIDWWIIKHEPFKTLPVLTGHAVTNTDGAFVSTVYSLSEDSYKLFWANPEGIGAKHKVFKVSCQPTPSGSPSTSPSPVTSPTPTSTPTVTPSPTPLATPTPSPTPSGSPELSSPSPSPTSVSSPSPAPSTSVGPKTRNLPSTDTDESPYTAPLFLLSAIGTVAYLLIWKFVRPYGKR